MCIYGRGRLEEKKEEKEKVGGDSVLLIFMNDR